MVHLVLPRCAVLLVKGKGSNDLFHRCTVCYTTRVCPSQPLCEHACVCACVCVRVCVCSERLASCKPRRQDPYSSLPEGSQQREMGLPTAVLFTGSNLVGANPPHTTEQPTTHSTVTTSARDPESAQPASNPTHGSSSLKWQKPPALSQVVDRGERLPQLVSHRSDPQSLPKGRQSGEKQGGERGEVGRAGVWPSVSCDNQVNKHGCH